jgi:putative methyltransferase (TIGR04325 family)
MSKLNLIKNKIKKFLPNFIIKIYHRYFTIKFIYGYKSFKHAKQSCGYGYDSNLIINKIYKAAKLVPKKKKYERDGVNFDEIQYSWPLLSSILLATNNNKLNVLDFGGSFGTSFYQNQKFLKYIKKIKWNIVEQKKIVNIAKNNNFINFYENIDDIKTKPDIAIFCCSLCYLEDPYNVLKKVINIKPNLIAIDRTPFTEQKEDLFGIQVVNKKIYPARLPIITFSINKFINFFKKEYILIEKWVAEEQPELSDNYKGFLFKKRY